MAKFENKNFRVESGTDGWEEINIGGKICLGNSKADIFEIVEGEYKSEQLFTYAAAIRETSKADKTMPTNDDFSKSFIVKTDMPNLVLVGSSEFGMLNGQGKGVNFWSLTEGGYCVYREVFPYRAVVHIAGHSSYIKNRAFFSVRCLE